MPAEATPGPDRKYWAFISYSHQDKEWGDWLHASLERYRVPRRLVGRATPLGPVPRRLFPVFRDREELPGSSDLGQNIDGALRASRTLIVICSPRAAASRWVNEEIKTYKALSGESRILCLIVDGEPNASDDPDCGLLEAFPEAVRYRVTSERELTEERTEPIAADARPEGDGKADARLKLVAGVLGVPFDELKQRDRRRRLWRGVQAAVAATLVLALIGATWYRGHQNARAEARARHLQLARLMHQKTRDSRALHQEAAATLYAAHSLRHSLLAGAEPEDVDLFSSLSPPVLLGQTLGDVAFERGLSIHPAGDLVAAGGRDGAVYLVSLEQGSVVMRLPAHEGPVRAVAFAPDGTLLASAGEDGSIALLEVSSARVVARLRAHAGPVRALAFHPESERLLSGGADGTLRLWDVGTHIQLAVREAHDAEVNGLAFSPDGQRIASGGQDNAIRLFGSDGLDLEAELVRYREPVMSVRFSPDGRRLAAAVRDGSAKLFDLEESREVASLGRHRTAVFDVAWSPDGEMLVSTSRDHSMKLWEVSTFEELATVTGHSDEVWSAAFHPDGMRFVSGSLDGSLKVWRVSAHENLFTLPLEAGPVRGVAWSPDGSRLAACADDQSIQLFDVATRRLLLRFEGHENSVRALAFSPDGRMLASASRDKTVRLWDAATGEPLAVVPAHEKYAVGLAFHPGGKLLASAGWDRRVRLWAVPSLDRVHSFEGHTAEVSGVAFHPDGRRLASASYDGSVRLWDVQTRAPLAILEAHERHVRTVAFSPDGALLASGGWDRHIRLWDLGSLEETNSLRAHHTQEVWQLAFRPDSRVLASATPSEDRHTIRLFDVREQRLLDWLSGHDRYALAVAFSSDGTRLASGGTDGVVRVWSVEHPFSRQADAEVEGGDPGLLLRRFLEAPPYELGELDAVVARIEALTGFSLVGTEALARPTGARLANR